MTWQARSVQQAFKVANVIMPNLLLLAFSRAGELRRAVLVVIRTCSQEIDPFSLHFTLFLHATSFTRPRSESDLSDSMSFGYSTVVSDLRKMVLRQCNAGCKLHLTAHSSSGCTAPAQLQVHEVLVLQHN